MRVCSWPFCEGAYRRTADVMRWLVTYVLIPGLLWGAGPALADLPELIERVKPSVVVIGTLQRTRSPQFVMRGTGFVVGDGYEVATNAPLI